MSFKLIAPYGETKATIALWRRKRQMELP